ncbi:MAG: hypothetical protein JWM90_1106 [Thermoleophilia bacterium]|nr:hypothetical protein [Thermoleophilia bacterium]
MCTPVAASPVLSTVTPSAAPAPTAVAAATGGGQGALAAPLPTDPAALQGAATVQATPTTQAGGDVAPGASSCCADATAGAGTIGSGPTGVTGGGPADLATAVADLGAAVKNLETVLADLGMTGAPVQPAVDAAAAGTTTGGGATPAPEPAAAPTPPPAAPAPAPAQAAAGEKAIYPVGTEKISDEFGATKGRMTSHGGTDFARGTGTEIKASLSGKVVSAGPNGGWGNQILIEHPGGLFTRYAHLVDGGIGVKVGQEVKQGDSIGKVGSTGNSTGPHLHFEVYEGGTAAANRRDPHVWLDSGALKADKNPQADH